MVYSAKTEKIFMGNFDGGSRSTQYGLFD